MKQIGLVIPAYNEEKIIGKTLEHVLKSGQQFSEIIVVDNASDDRTAEIASSFVGVKVIKEPRKGVQWARQRGYEESKSEIIAFMDADNKMPGNWLKKIETAFEKNEALALLSGPYHYYDIAWHDKFLVWMYWFFAGMPTYFITGYMSIAGNMAIRRSVLHKMGGFNTNIDFYGDDTDTARRAKKHGTVKFSISFVMLASGRRLLKKGTWKMAGIYGLNFASLVLRNKPFHSTHDDIR